MNPLYNHSPSPGLQTWLFALFSFSSSCRPVLLEGNTRQELLDKLHTLKNSTLCSLGHWHIFTTETRCLPEEWRCFSVCLAPAVILWPLHGQVRHLISPLSTTLSSLGHFLLEPLLCSCRPRSVFVGNLRNLPAWQLAEKPLKELTVQSSRRPCACVPLFPFTFPFLMHSFFAEGTCGT